MEEKRYMVVGFQYGTFKDANAKDVRYAQLFCNSEISGEQTESFHFTGRKAHVFKCVNDTVLDGVKPGDVVSLYFNQYNKVSLIVSQPS